jgi:hypothetical protein
MRDLGRRRINHTRFRGTEFCAADQFFTELYMVIFRKITSALPIIQNYLPETVDSGRIIFSGLMISRHPEPHNGVRSG